LRKPRGIHLQGIRRVEILDEKGMLDLGRGVEEQHDLVVRSQRGI
jgi:hypothetical protein